MKIEERHQESSLKFNNISCLGMTRLCLFLLYLTVPCVTREPEQTRMTQQEDWMRMWKTSLSSPAPQRCQNCHLVFGLAGEHSCSTGRLLSHTGWGEREGQEKKTIERRWQRMRNEWTWTFRYKNYKESDRLKGNRDKSCRKIWMKKWKK